MTHVPQDNLPPHHTRLAGGQVERDDADLIENLFGVRPEGSPRMSRAEHLAWAKERALAEVDADPAMALTSLISDFGKHPNLVDHAGIMLGSMMLLSLAQQSKPKAEVAREMRSIIEGCN